MTEADQAAEAIIVTKLRLLTPNIPVVAEEEVAVGKQTHIESGLFWLVDPLDGTREFISRNGEFTVNIALIRNWEPVIGTVHVPVKAETYTAAGPREVTCQRGNNPVAVIGARRPAKDGIVAMVSRSHASQETDEFLAGILRYLPGIQSPYHFHEGCEHFQYILEGRGVVVTEDGEPPVRPGTLIFVHEGENHQVKSLGGRLKFLEFQIPIRFKTTILDGGDMDLRWFHDDGRVFRQS